MAGQDQSLFTRNYSAKIIKNGADPKCQFCEKCEETVDHLVSGCPIKAPNQYLQRHDRVGQYIQRKIYQHYNAPYAKNRFEYTDISHRKLQKWKVQWDFSIHTDKTKQANKPDITIKDHKEKACKLIDFSFPIDINISAKEFEKLSKYQDLQIEVERMWQLKTSIIPIVVSALGQVKNGTVKHCEKITGKQNLVVIQKKYLVVLHTY